jgi:hypothetical protein
MDLTSYLDERVTAALAAVPSAERPDVYAVSLYVYDEDDEPEQPTLTVGTNTERQVQLALAGESGGWGSPTDEAEARWNYAFWQQNQLAVLCNSLDDPDGDELRNEWIAANGWAVDWDAADADDKAEKITRGFVEVCVQLAQRLHETGELERLFGRPIPVIVHELEYYDEIAEQNLRANPPGVADGLVDWIRSQ